MDGARDGRALSQDVEGRRAQHRGLQRPRRGGQGAAPLLGMGGTFYMAGGGRTQRARGPFVPDDGVEKVVAHLKLQGAPEYLEAITADDGEEGDDDDARGGGGGGGVAG